MLCIVETLPVLIVLGMGWDGMGWDGVGRGGIRQVQDGGQDS